MVADPLEILCAEKQMRAGGNLSRVLHHVGQEFTKDRVVAHIHALVPGTQPGKSGRIARAIEAGEFVQLTEHKLRHGVDGMREDRKSTRLNSSHVKISYAVFCLKKK